jgi:anaphase-promoting complex subunit 1
VLKSFTLASVTSLGLHQPTALSHFIQERLVGPEPSNDDYTWQTEASNGADDQDGDDELLVTKTCVAWSRGGILRKAYRFEVEEEPVTRAILTYFAPPMKAKNGGIQGKDTTEKEELRNTSQSKSDHSQDQQKSKALVVFLKTQAHVYFLSGTSHVVHLPFEIEYAAAAPNGVIMQRKPQAQKHISGSLKFPKVPPNSFISSQPQPWSANSSVQSTFSIASLGSPKQLMLPQTSLLGDLWQTPTLKDDTNWPRLFSLTDPLSEMGLVVTAGSSDGSRRTSLKTLALDPAEEIIHVTERGEFSSIESSNCDPLILAMTVNRETSICTVWRVTYVEQEDIIRSRPAHTSGAVSRRRSSFAPGTGTGATTPVGNSQYTFRESLGGNSLVVPKNSNRHQDDTPEEKLNFAASLDPDFESAALPRRKSRRVSSMLARADLSASHERSAFSELASAHPPHAGRRGDSLGSQHNRTSFGHHISINGHANLGSSQLGNSLNSFLEAPVDDLLDELRAGGDFEGFHNMGLDDEDFEGLRKEIIFTKIESLPLEQSNVRFSIQREPAQKQCRVFTLVAPPCASEDPRKSQIVICALDINEKKLLVLTLDTDRQTKMVHSGYSSRKRGSDSEKDIIKISCGESKRANGVLDACKLTDGSITRILILTESSDGQGYLTLQAPWSVLTTVSLPQQLALNNLRSLGHDPVPQKRRDGGFGRVLSQGAGALRSLKNSMPGGMVDVLDDDGKLHQLNIRMEPLNPAVKQIINVCRFVLPGARSREAVLVCWWNAMQWLGGDNKKVCDSEWTAIVITLFSMILGTQDRANQSSPDRKRRSKQSLRSSSGAQPDDENWQLMLGHELANGFSHPSWMTNKGWEWLSEQQITRPSSSGRPNSSSSWAAGSRVADDHPGFLQRHIKLTREFLGSNLGQTAAGPSGYLPTAPNKRQDTCRNAISDIIVGLHLLREEQKLDIGCTDSINSGAGNLVLVLAQLCKWVGWHEWVSGYDVEDALTEFIILDSSKFPATQNVALTDMKKGKPISIQPPSSPPDVYEWIESCLVSRKLSPFVSIADITASRSTLGHQAAPHIEQWSTLTPRTAMFGRFFAKVQPDSLPSHLVEALYDAGIGAQILDTLPESVLVPLRETIVNCQDQPPLTWGQDLLGFVDRDDVNMLLFPEQRKQLAPSSTLVSLSIRDLDHYLTHHRLRHTKRVLMFTRSVVVYQIPKPLDLSMALRRLIVRQSLDSSSKMTGGSTKLLRF